METETKNTVPPSSPGKMMTEDDVRTLISQALNNFAETMRVQSGIIQSGNFVTGSIGWRLTADGSLEANNGTFRGAITASSGSITGNLTVSGSLSFGKTAYSDDAHAGYWLGVESGTPKFKIGTSSDNYLGYDGTNLYVIGGFIKTEIPSGSSGRAVLINGGANADVEFYNNTTLKGYIGGYTDGGSDGENEYMRMYAASGRSISIQESRVLINGDFVVVGGYYIKIGSNKYGVDSGTFTDADGHTIRVRGGMITNLNE